MIENDVMVYVIARIDSEDFDKLKMSQAWNRFRRLNTYTVYLYYFFKRLKIREEGIESALSCVAPLCLFDRCYVCKGSVQPIYFGPICSFFVGFISYMSVCDRRLLYFKTTAVVNSAPLLLPVVLRLFIKDPVVKSKYLQWYDFSFVEPC